MSRRQLIKLLPVISGLMLVFLASKPSHAQQFSLGIYPPIIQVDALSPAKIEAPISLENFSSESVNLSVQLRQFIPSDAQNGEIVFVDNPDSPHKNVFNKVRIKENGLNRTRFTMSPKQKKNLTLEINLDENVADSDYYFSVLFVSNPELNPDLSESYASGAVATNVLLSVGEKDVPRGEIKEFSAPFFVTKGPMDFKVNVENKSPYFITTEGNILVKNIFGQTIGNLELLNSNILGNSGKYLVNKDGSEASLDNPRVVWGEKFLLGVYTADLTLSLSEQGPILRDSIRFVAIPLEIILGFLFAVMAVVFIYIRVRKKMRTYEEN